MPLMYLLANAPDRAPEVTRDYGCGSDFHATIYLCLSSVAITQTTVLQFSSASFDPGPMHFLASLEAFIHTQKI